MKMKDIYSEHPDENEQSELGNFFGEDMVARGDWADLCAQASTAEGKILADGAVTQSDAYDAVRDSLYFIEQQIGDSYASGIAEVVGWAHKIEYVQTQDGETIDTVAEVDEQLLGFDGSNMGTYDGVGLVSLAGRWRVMLQIDLSQASGVDAPGVYGFLMGEDKVVQLSLYADNEPGVVDPAEDIRSAGEDAQQTVVSSEFLAADSLTQRQLLGDFVVRHEHDLSEHLRDTEVVVATTQYYGMSPLFPGELFPVDIDLDDKHLDCFLLEGKIGSFWYPDLESVDIEKQLTVDDFGIGTGAPYLTLEKRDAYGERIATYYIPTNDVQDIAAINADDEFDSTDDE